MDGREINNLAKKCRVPMYRACQRAGIATTTPWRWQQGAVAHQKTVRHLERAIFEMASEAGTVPEELAERCRRVLAHQEPDRRSTRDIIESIRRDLKDLERVMGA